MSTPPNRYLTITNSRWVGWPGIFMLSLIAAVGIFTVVPGSVESKSLAVLHGLCAQQPSHSYYFGEGRLPFDSRMTGIYGGFTMTALFLLARRRWRSAGVRDVRVAAILGVMILPLAVDGTNSFLKDIGVPYLYEPRNAVRTLTGLLTGTSLATFIWMLVGQTALVRGRKTAMPVWNGVGELAALLALQLVFLALVTTAWTPLRLPLSYLLMLAAVSVLTGLMLPFVLLVLRRENQARETWELAGPATLALALAFLVMSVTSGGRFAVEAIFGLPAQLPA